MSGFDIKTPQEFLFFSKFPGLKIFLFSGSFAIFFIIISGRSQQIVDAHFLSLLKGKSMAV
jgi:hypothetical protein